jgi:hypothetical protein
MSISYQNSKSKPHKKICNWCKFRLSFFGTTFILNKFHINKLFCVICNSFIKRSIESPRLCTVWIIKFQRNTKIFFKNFQLKPKTDHNIKQKVRNLFFRQFVSRKIFLRISTILIIGIESATDMSSRSVFI